MPIENLKGRKVLDLGSNQGFFSLQAALAGASEVTGIEITAPDVQAAEEIKKIMNLNNVNFINTDIIKYIERSRDKYSLIVLNSVLHQIFPNFKHKSNKSLCDLFMKKLSRMTEILVLETPLNHKYMKLSPKEVQKKLRRLGFPWVRLLYIYDAYSTGYRANYLCYTKQFPGC